MVVLSAAVCTKSGRAVRLPCCLHPKLLQRSPPSLTRSCLPPLPSAPLLNSFPQLLSRQYVEMSRLRVEGLLNAFPKLIASEGLAGSSSKQHTFVETDNVRYVYLPLDASLYLLLVTNKGSNIVEDLDTLRLLSRVIPEQLGIGVAMTELNVNAKAFELLFAFDEVLASGGYREEVTLHQVRGWAAGEGRGSAVQCSAAQCPSVHASPTSHTRHTQPPPNPRCASTWRWSPTRRSWQR
jgi:hypothetical protein